MSSTAVVIPARYESSRLPGKVLLDRTGRYLVQHVYERAEACDRVDEVHIATPDDSVERAAREFDASIVRTGKHTSGTSRVSEAVQSLSADYIVNLQADEPEVGCTELHTLLDLIEREDTSMATLAAPVKDPDILMDPNCVQVVVGRDGRALYFSRAPIPWERDLFDGIEEESWQSGSVRSRLAERLENLPEDENPWNLHVGIYAFERDVIERWTDLEEGILEEVEKLEQLRALENGIDIRVGRIPEPTVGVDTEADYTAFVQRQQGRKR